MTDLIFWGSDYNAFLVEAYEKSPELVGRDEDIETGEPGDYFTKFSQTPMEMNDIGEFMFLVRTSDGEVGYFARLQSIDNLGAYEAVLNAPPKRAIYDRIYPNEPYDIIDDGETITITPPERFGEFL